MRADETELSAEALARIRRDGQSFVVGLGLMVFGALVAGVPVMLRGEIQTTAAVVGVVIIMAGGLLNRPKTFEKITRWAIAALPGGKE